tara:strand:- start:84 stop:395 length:312 start_codon:yes stop_codon:yes gene_type:complete
MQKIIKLIENLPKPLRNKYILTLVLFLLWVVFLDDYNLINQSKIKKKVDELKSKKEFYMSEIKNDSTELKELKNKKEKQEKIARERFLMKKENEEIFIIRNNE